MNYWLPKKQPENPSPKPPAPPGQRPIRLVLDEVERYRLG
jgi:hypothetical protein